MNERVLITREWISGTRFLTGFGRLNQRGKILFSGEVSSLKCNTVMYSAQASRGTQMYTNDLYSIFWVLCYYTNLEKRLNHRKIMLGCFSRPKLARDLSVGERGSSEDDWHTAIIRSIDRLTLLLSEVILTMAPAHSIPLPTQPDPKRQKTRGQRWQRRQSTEKRGKYGAPKVLY